MPHHLSLSALLQLPHRLCKESGTSAPPVSKAQHTDHYLQYWRLITTFFYFGPLSLDLLYHIFFLQRYSRLLEESSGRSPAHFSWLLTFASTLLLCIAPMLSMAFLGSALSSTLIYIWSRKNPETHLSFLGLVVFKAPYLPWVLLCFSLIMHGTIPKDEMCGIVVGHSKLSIRNLSDLADGSSLVLLQRCLPASPQRPQPARPSFVVDPSLRRAAPTSRRTSRQRGFYGPARGRGYDPARANTSSSIGTAYFGRSAAPQTHS